VPFLRRTWRLESRPAPRRMARGQTCLDGQLPVPTFQRSRCRGGRYSDDATSGLSGSISSASAALASSLVSRLKQRSATAGSTLFNLTWKESTTPSQRPVSLLRASVRRISDNDCGSWPSPTSAAEQSARAGPSGPGDTRTAQDHAGVAGSVSLGRAGNNHHKGLEGQRGGHSRGRTTARSGSISCRVKRIWRGGPRPTRGIITRRDRITTPRRTAAVLPP
jgi:hypothetical protein